MRPLVKSLLIGLVCLTSGLAIGSFFGHGENVHIQKAKFKGDSQLEASDCELLKEQLKDCRKKKRNR